MLLNIILQFDTDESCGDQTLDSDYPSDGSESLSNSSENEEYLSKSTNDKRWKKRKPVSCNRQQEKNPKKNVEVQIPNCEENNISPDAVLKSIQDMPNVMRAICNAWPTRDLSSFVFSEELEQTPNTPEAAPGLPDQLYLNLNIVVIHDLIIK